MGLFSREIPGANLHFYSELKELAKRGAEFRAYGNIRTVYTRNGTPGLHVGLEFGRIRNYEENFLFVPVAANFPVVLTQVWSVSRNSHCRSPFGDTPSYIKGADGHLYVFDNYYWFDGSGNSGLSVVTTDLSGDYETFDEARVLIPDVKTIPDTSLNPTPDDLWFTELNKGDFQLINSLIRDIKAGKFTLHSAYK